MDSSNPVTTLCIEGIWAELEHRFDDARQIYQQAWHSCTNDYEACIASHYLARSQVTPEDSLHWHLLALEFAYAVHPDLIRDFYPSLYMSIAHAYKRLGGTVQAQRYYRLAAGLGEVHPLESEDEMVRWLKVFDWVEPFMTDTV